MIGSNNAKMVSELANLASIRKQVGDATERMRQHLKERIAVTQDQIAALEKEQLQAQKTLITVQGQRSRLAELQHDVVFRSDQLNAREKAAEEAKLKSKLTFSDMTVLDKATPPLEPSFPKPMSVISARNRSRTRARPVACAARRGDRSQGPLADRSRIFGVGPVPGQP